MGYSTDFSGKFTLNKPLDDETYKLLADLNQTRRMARQLGPEYGAEGEFYVDGEAGESVIDYNRPPSTQPSLWCQWQPTEDRMSIIWDGGEKFYEYVDWIKYIINRVLDPKGYVLNGEVWWDGEDQSDTGLISNTDNKVNIKQATTIYF